MTENIKDAIEYGVELARGQEVIHLVNDKNFVDTTKGRLEELEPIKYAKTLNVGTLTSLVKFLKEKFDEKEPAPLLIHVESPTKVSVKSRLNADRKRESIIEAFAELDNYPFGRFMDSEKFIINILSLFQRDENSEIVRRVASSIRIEGGGDLQDDGVSQIVTAKVGAATTEKAEVPSPVELRPYRTFLEVEQPVSPFIFRINKDGFCALFDADGGMWRYHAIQNILEYLESSLSEEIEEGYISIIA
ncbi:hypothetical protein [Enterococcus dispar]